MRPDLDIIAALVTPGSRVLDLGCGDGGLLRQLRDSKQVRGMGLEIDPENINQCLRQGIPVIEQDLDEGLGYFEDGSFDTVVLGQTLQALGNPSRIVDEMLRVGRQGIVTFPNFGHWKCRLHLLRRGRMPVAKFMPHQWYDTPNIHFCTLRDFNDLCEKKAIRILQRTVVDSRHRGTWHMKLWPNVLGEIAIYHLARAAE